MKGSHLMNRTNKIDAVITWVNGSDKDFIKSKNKYRDIEGSKYYSDEEFGDHRYIQNDELKYLLHSIVKFAPFIDTIYIVHCQTTEITKLIDDMPLLSIKEKIKPIHHSIIFRGYEKYLPTFNSLSIETLLHKIPNLSDKYIYFNDDFFLLRQTKISDFFDNGIPVSSGYLAHTNSIAVKYDSYKAISSRTVGFVIPMKNTIRALDGIKNGTFVRLYHSPYVFRKSTLDNFFEHNQSALIANINHRFRSYDQFSTASLAATLEYRNEKAKPKKLFRHIYLKPVSKFPGYSILKIIPFILFKRVIFGCFQNISEAKVSVKLFLAKWLNKRIIG